MVKLFELVGYPTLCEKIVGQFAFMKAMADNKHSKYEALNTLSLDAVYSKAIKYFKPLTTIEELIESEQCNLSERITEFLAEWKEIVDVTAIQQNVHYQLKIEDEA